MRITILARGACFNVAPALSLWIKYFLLGDVLIIDMLIDFYGKECPHCHNMEPLVERLEKEIGVKVDRVEVWHDAENAKKMEGYDNGRCGGVPFFVNTDTNAAVCGEVSYEELKKWATTNSASKI